MDINELLSGFAQLTVFSIMLSMGMALGFTGISRLWRRISLLLRCLVAAFVVVPLAAMVVTKVLPLPFEVRAGIAAMAVIPGAPVIYRKMLKGPGDAELAGSFQATMALLSVVLVPLWFGIISAIYPTEASASLAVVFKQVMAVQGVPLLVGAAIAPRQQEILNQIRDTRVLKVAMRRDVAPFGYIDQQNQWSGYCRDLSVALGEYLSKELNIPLGVQVSPLPSTLENRFSLVQNDTAYLECGPNTIRDDIQGISFSIPFGVTGTRFLSQQQNAATFEENPSLESLRIGVLKNTTTEQFVQSNYPNANIVYFEGIEGRINAVKAVTSGTIDTFAGDTLLSVAELSRQNLPLENYALQPRLPLTCDFYGLILPTNDTEWQLVVNRFMMEESARKAREKWFLESLTSESSDFDLQYCFNR